MPNLGSLYVACRRFLCSGLGFLPCAQRVMDRYYWLICVCPSMGTALGDHLALLA